MAEPAPTYLPDPAAVLGGVTIPGYRDSVGWLWFYAACLQGTCGPEWQDFAESHEASGRTDGTSWMKWRDESLAAVPGPRPGGTDG